MTIRAEQRLIAGDAVLEALIAEPFTLAQAKPQSAAFVFASPHSGQLYPPSFMAKSALDALELCQSEDAFVDELFASVSAFGAPLIAARFPRAFVDANRAATEIDPAMFDALPALPMTRTARVTAGLGVIPRIVRDGLEIYRERLPAREAAFRLDSFYGPYHAALAKLVKETRLHFGIAVVVDCHSMPSSTRMPDIVLGDHYGESAASTLVAHAREALRAAGFTVGYNMPYAGGHTTLTYGKPTHGLHALQIEINRALYLDERRMEKLPAFTELKTRLEEFIARLVTADPALCSAVHAPQRERA